MNFPVPEGLEEVAERLLKQYRVDDLSKVPIKAWKREIRRAKQEKKLANKQIRELQDKLDRYYAYVERLANMDYDEFYNEALQADFPDEMVFQLNRETPSPNTTFSEEGVEGVIRKIQAFTLARTRGHWKREGVAPQALKIHVRLEWGAMTPKEALEAGGHPWYNVTDLPDVDGSHRLKQGDNEN